MENKEIALVTQYKAEINAQLEDKEALNSLMEITFKGLTPQLAKRAMLEGYMRGHTFTDFLNKNVYAIPYKNYKTQEVTYTLITSIDYARQKVKNLGKSAPVFTYYDEERKNIESCSVTVKRKVDGEIGEWTATVYFDEYTTGKNLWISKPRTMIAKVAEMHALRMAAPQELAKAYAEEEFDKENAKEGTYTVIRKQEPFEQEEKPNMLLHQSKRNTEDIPADIEKELAQELEAQTDK